MRLALAATGLLVFGAIALAATATRAQAVPPQSAANPRARTVAPLATADPTDVSRVEPETQFGGLPALERIDRRRTVVRGLIVPIAGVAIPTDPDSLPNAPREYRAGWHEGIDFPADPGTPVRAIAAGTIVRIDHGFVEWDPAAEQFALDEAVRLGYTPEATLDRIRGRQVWIDHGHGVVSRYAHLAAVADLGVGELVGPGTVVGQVGSTGFPEGGPHLHLEIRVRSSYLGDGLSGDALLAAVTAAFD
ncbi:MAG TPA: M23 family metallopeptidase [Candidatus Limnocylindria bacterium]|jgi:murein DD-endopeptidase MepM/ murein hydrolase activator NlpD